MVSNFALMINNAFVKLERSKSGEIIRAFHTTIKHSSDLVYLKGSRDTRIWKSVKTPPKVDETEIIKDKVYDLLEEIIKSEQRSAVGKIIGDIPTPLDFVGKGRVINYKTFVYETMVVLAEKFVTNPYQRFSIPDPTTRALVDITEQLTQEMPRFIERELAACAWQVPIVEKLYCSRLKYGLDNQAALFTEDGKRFMSLFEFDVPGIINWFKIIRKNPTISSSSIYNLEKFYDEPQIIPHISVKNNVMVSMVTPTDALTMLGVDMKDVPYDSFSSAPLLMIFFALCFHEIFPDTKHIVTLLASNKESMYIETYDDEGFALRRDRVIDETTFTRETLSSNQNIVYSSPLEMYLNAWVDSPSSNLITKFGGLSL